MASLITFSSKVGWIPNSTLEACGDHEIEDIEKGGHEGRAEGRGKGAGGKVA